MKGQVVQKGIAIGHVRWIQEESHVEITYVEDPKPEIQAFQDAIETARQDLSKLKKKASIEAGEHEAQIFEAYLMMLDDPSLIEPVLDHITNEGLNAISACYKVYGQTIEMFENLEDDYLKQRATDIRDLRKRLIGNLTGVDKTVGSDSSVILVAHEITPSDTLEMDRNLLAGMLMMTGGETSHTAILAQSLGIPALVGCGDSLKDIEDGALVVLDGMQGQVIVNPDEAVLDKYKKMQIAYQEEKNELKRFIGLKSQTQSGQLVEIAANIAGPSDLISVLENDAEGVGLFRTEFIYMNRTSAPNLQEQIEIYKEILVGLDGKTIIFRTMDIGGDKEVDYLGIETEANPFLGYRAIRYCLKEKDFFKTQISAILQAAVHGKAKIMFPMISSVEEFLEAKGLVQEVMNELDQEGIAYDASVPLGIMIEIPAAAILVDDFAEHVDFFSIGTNDLTQYTLAVDRQNSLIAHLYDPMHPAVLSLIEKVVKTGKKTDTWVGMCGNAASDPRMIQKLMEWGIDEISVSPSKVLECRKYIRTLK